MSDTIFFDLDGTLTDPGIGITRSIQYALERLGLDVPAQDELNLRECILASKLHSSFNCYLPWLCIPIVWTRPLLLMFYLIYQHEYRLTVWFPFEADLLP